MAHPVVGLPVSSDVFVDYSLQATTSNQQVISLEIPLRIPEPNPDEVATASFVEAQLKDVMKQKIWISVDPVTLPTF
jgi:hypothetical protein